MKPILINSLIYFSLVFFVGFILGTIRVLFVVPLLGERFAELMEMPLMLIATYYSARYIVNRCSVITKLSDYIYMGIIALLMLIIFELTLVLEIRGMSIEQYISSRDPVSGTFYLLSLFIYMIMPFIIAKNKS